MLLADSQERAREQSWERQGGSRGGLAVGSGRVVGERRAESGGVGGWGGVVGSGEKRPA